MTARLLDIDANTYHADQLGDQPTLSASIAKTLIGQSPAHAKAAHPRLNPNLKRDDDPKYDVGNIAHALFLQGLDLIEVCEYPDWRSKAAKEARALAREHGRIPMLTAQSVEVYAMVNAIREQLHHLAITPRLFADGKPEQTLVWEEQGVMCRARLDWPHDDLTTLDDLKTTSRCARGEVWSKRALYDQGAEIQAAMHLRGVRALTGRDAQWRWVVVETSPPYALSVIYPSAAVLALGDEKVDRALALWRQCLATDEWPAYSREPYRAELPPWLEAQWLEQREEIAA